MPKSKRKNKHFNVDNPEGIICCVKCGKLLWRMKILKAASGCLSTRMEPIGETGHYNKKNSVCPHCKDSFIRKDGKVKILSEITKESFYI